MTDLADSAGYLQGIRQHLHANPELSFKEAATSALVATRLEQWGYEVDFDDSNLRVGAAYRTRLVERFLSQDQI